MGGDLTWMLMSELLSSDWVVELREDCDAQLPLVVDLGELLLIGESVTVMLMIGGSALGRAAAGEGAREGLLLTGPSTDTSVRGS